MLITEFAKLILVALCISESLSSGSPKTVTYFADSEENQSALSNAENVYEELLDADLEAETSSIEAAPYGYESNPDLYLSTVRRYFITQCIK
jgi:hypothetical protein